MPRISRTWFVKFVALFPLLAQQDLAHFRFRIVDHPQLLSNTIVRHRVGSNASQVNPGWLGLPVRAKLAQAVAIFCASA